MSILYSHRWSWSIINYRKQRLRIQQIKSKSPPRPIPLTLCTLLPKIKRSLRLHTKDYTSMCNIKRSWVFGREVKLPISVSAAYMLLDIVFTPYTNQYSPSEMYRPRNYPRKTDDALSELTSKVTQSQLKAAGRIPVPTNEMLVNRTAECTV